MNTFLSSKIEFDNLYKNKKIFRSFLPVHLNENKECSIKDKHNMPSEDYYKWQFFYALVYSGLYAKDFIGTEVHFPKGNQNSACIKFDGAIFDDKKWFSYYKKFHKNKSQEALDWLRKHLLAVFEFKKDQSIDVESIYNQQ